MQDNLHYKYWDFPKKNMFYLSEKPVYFPNIGNKYTLEKLRLSLKCTCNVLFFQAVYSCRNSCQLFNELRYFQMPFSYHIFDGLVDKYMLSMQKVWGSILRHGRHFFKFQMRVYKSFYTDNNK